MNDYIKNLLKDKTIFVVSDLHMGDGSPADNFEEYKERFESFLDMVKKVPNSVIILTGDTFDLWQSQIGDVVEKYFDIIKRLVDMGSIFIVGNHDMDLLGFTKLASRAINNEKLHYLTNDVEFYRNGKRFIILHGHQFDVYNDPNKSVSIGKIAALLVGMAEREIGKKNRFINIERKIRATEPIFRHISSFFVKLYRRFFATTASERIRKGKSINEVYEKMYELKDTDEDIFLITGHTHKAGWIEDWYANPGAWWTENAHYVKIDLEGNVELYSWPENKKVENQLY